MFTVCSVYFRNLQSGQNDQVVIVQWWAPSIAPINDTVINATEYVFILGI